MNQVFAQTLNIDNQYSITGTVGKFTNIGSILNEAVPFIFAFAGIGLLLMLLAAGFNFLTSAGDPKKLETGKQRLTNALVGFLVIFVAYWAVQMAGVIFGIKEIQDTFPIR